MEEKDSRKVPQSNFRGLYSKVRISVKTLDRILVVSIALLIVLVLYGVANAGYTVTFDSKGGTDVPSQDAMYADYVIEPEAPTREGYVFTGWYSDENCNYLWDMENGQISQSMTLYAGWEKNE